MKNIKKYLKKNKKEIIIISLTTLLFIILSLLVITNKTTKFDTLIHSYILNIRTTSLTKILTIITNLAGASFLLALSILLFIFMKNKKIPLYMFFNLIFAFFINEIAKSIFLRSRPIGINLIDENGLSFPSGHSMVGLSFYGFIIYLLIKKMKNQRLKYIYITLLSILIITIGFSRIYLGVHYFTDIIGGFLLAIIYLYIYLKFVNLEKKWSIWKLSELLPNITHFI